MKSHARMRLCRALIWIPLGTLWLGGCVTDGQFRDFVSTTSVRTFWQTIGSAVQAALVADPQG